MSDASGVSRTVPHPPRHWRWYYTLFILAVLFLLLFAGWHWALRATFDARLAEIRAAGYPATPAELDAWYAYPPVGQVNPADAFLDAFSYIQDVEEEISKQLPVRGWATLPEDPAEPLPPEQIAALKQDVAANAQALEKLHAAVAAPVETARWPVDMSRGYSMVLMPLSTVRSASNLLLEEAHLAAEEGDAQGVVRSIQAALRVGRSLEREPVLITQLVRVAVHAHASQRMRRFLHHVRFSDAQLVQLMEALEAAESPHAMERAVAGERAMLHQIFREMPAADLSSSMGSFILLYKATGLMNLDGLAALKHMNRSIAAWQGPEHLRGAELAALDNELLDLPKWRGMFTKIFITSLNRMSVIELRSVAELRLARTALALERYRMKHGAYPEKLQALAPDFIPALPLDPFTGKPLLYKLLPEGGCLIYSTSDDGVDDGGRKTNAAGHQYEPGSDIPFRLER